jgi:hypothetical protein
MKIFIISDWLDNIEKQSRLRARKLIKSIEGKPIDEQVKIISKMI